MTSLQLHTGNTRLLVGCEGPTTYDLSLARLFEREGKPRPSSHDSAYMIRFAGIAKAVVVCDGSLH